MKKIVFIFLFDFILLGICGFTFLFINKYSNKKEVEMVNGIDSIYEEVLPIRDSNNNFLGVSTTIVIPSNYSSKKIKLTPNIFGGLSEYKSVTLGDSLVVDLVIENKSKYKYKYRKNSFILSTPDIVDVGNYKDTLGVGFDGKKLYDLFSPYRVFNSALRELYSGKNIGNLSDDNLDSILKEKGYNGISQLDKYYLDYYNKKYDYEVERLEELPYSIIKEIFDGNVSHYKESNIGVIEVAYYYFYNKVIAVSFLGEQVSDSNSENFSIGKFMESGSKDKFFENIVVDGKNIKIEGIRISINKVYFTESFKDYKYLGEFGFTLDRE